MSEGEWTELYAREASWPACLYMTLHRQHLGALLWLSPTVSSAGMRRNEVSDIPHDVVHNNPAIILA